MCLYNLIADGKSDARTLILVAGMKPLEKLENRRVKLRVDPNSVIGDGNRDVSLRFRTTFDARRIRNDPNVSLDFNPRIWALVILYTIGDEIGQ